MATCSMEGAQRTFTGFEALAFTEVTTGVTALPLN